MYKKLLNTYLVKSVSQAGLAVLVGLVGQSALAACPDTAGINITAADNVVGEAAGQQIYFCKQTFANTALSFAPTERQLLDGGSRAISKGKTAQTAPLLSRANLAGFNLNDLALNGLSANFPNVDGDFGSPSLFNFYTRVGKRNNCTSQYRLMRNYLRANPSVFQTTPLSGQASTDATGDNLVKITGAKLTSATDPTKTLTADISLYHTNAAKSGQYFTDGSIFTGYRDCWVGVGARVTINPNSGRLKYAGDYTLNIGVQTAP